MPASNQAFVGLLVLFTLVVMAGAFGQSHVQPVPVGQTKLETGTRIDVNTADAASLSLLPGIGPGIAQHIIDARESGMTFRNAEDLDTVKFIGQRLISRVEPWVMFSRKP